MGSISLISVVVLLQSLAAVLGEPSYTQYYPTVSRNYIPAYYYDSPSYYKSYYSNPSSYYKSYYTSPYYRYKNSYPKATYHDPDTVYITDKYGRTTATTSARIRALTYLTGCTTGRCSYGRAITHQHLHNEGTCTSSTCGVNAMCTIVGERPVCSCPKGTIGDPITSCRRVECLDSSNCPGHQTCRNDFCVNPCDGVCGANANCEVRNHVPVCSCPAGYTGDPFSHCRHFDPSELCHPNPCGDNTQCEVVNNVPTCKCLPGYHGAPLTGCRHECENDAECGPSFACIEFKCQNPCSVCGESAECHRVQNHVASCSCPKNYHGDPFVACRPECTSDSQCPAGKPACIYNACKNPCDGVCGVGANCELRGLTPVCSCPRDMTGDPFVRCRPFEKWDLCEPNPCGQNAVCIPGHDVTGKERPVCNCPAGFIGDPLKACFRGECTADEHCPDSQACVDYSCQNPCIGQCGVNANCNPKRHLAVCTCPPGYSGDALSQCYPSRGVSVGCDTCG